MRPHEFWKLTRYEYFQMVNGYYRRENKRYEDLLFLAWRTATWSYPYEAPKWSDVNSSLHQQEKPVKQQTSDEMLAMVKVLNAAFGGTVNEQ